MAKPPGFLDYVKKAFLQHWNLLFFGAGAVAGALSGHADVVLPLIAGAEIAYLFGLAAHPKFQAHVNAQAHKEARAQVDEAALQRIFSSLDPRSRARFEELRMRCRNLQTLARGLRQGTVESAEVESLHNEGINRLLWVFLKLLYTRNSLEQFLRRTDEEEIERSVAELERKVADLGPEAEDTAAEAKKRRTLQDTLQSARLRLDNLAKAKENYEFVQLELDRIDSKITSIAELAVNRQDPGFISSEVDGVTSTMEQTERAMSDLQFLAGLGEQEVAPPRFIDERVETTRR
jgi:chemotaxis protein histidine kinase CheA